MESSPVHRSAFSKTSAVFQTEPVLGQDFQRRFGKLQDFP